MSEKLLPIGTPVPSNTVMLSVPPDYSVIVQTERADDPTVVILKVDPSQTVVINGTAVPTQHKDKD